MAERRPSREAWFIILLEFASSIATKRIAKRSEIFLWHILACSRCSDSSTRAKNWRGKKTRGYYSGKRGAPVSLFFFPTFSPRTIQLAPHHLNALLLTIFKRFLLGRSSGKFPRATEHIIIIWKGSPVFFYRFGCPRLPRNKAVSKQNCHKTGPDVSFSGLWDVKKVFEALNFEGRNNTFMTKWKRFGPLADKTSKLYWLCWTSGADFCMHMFFKAMKCV